MGSHYEIGSGAGPESFARMAPPQREGLDINSCLRLVDAIRATLSASWTPGEKADAATVRQAMATLELLERRLAAHR